MRTVDVLIALAVLVPVGVALAAVIVGGDWTASGDRALQVLRVHDVGTAHSPLVGVYSRFGWSHPGPVQFWLLSPFYRTLGDTGVLAGTALLNLVALAAALWMAFRLGGRSLLVIVAIAEVVLVHTLTPTFLADPWNPWAALLPFLAFVLGAAALVMGDVVALPVMVVAGTFSVQTHVGYAPLVVGLGLLAVGALCVRAVLSRRRSPGDLRTAARAAAIPLALAAGAALLLWLPPIVQELTGRHGNISELVDYFRHPEETAAGWSIGVGIMGRQLAPIGPWLSGHETNATGMLGTAGVLPALLVLLVVALLGAVAWERGERAAAALAATVLVGDLLGTIATARVTGLLAPYIIRWWWVLAALTFVSGAWSALVLLVPARRRLSARASLGVAAAVCVLAVVLVLETLPLDVPDPQFSQATAALSEQLTRRLDRHRSYVVRSIDSVYLSSVATGVTTSLMVDGFRVYALPEYSLAVGDWRVRRESRADAMLIVVVGADERRGWTPPPGSRLVASVDPRSPATRREMDAVSARIRRDLGAWAPEGPIIPGPPGAQDQLVAHGARRSDVERLARLRAIGDSYSAYVAPVARS